MLLMALLRSTPLFWMPGRTRRVSMIRCFAALIAALVCGPTAGLAQGSVVIRDVTVIPMTGAGPVARQAVVIRNGRIAEMGPSAQIRIPAEARIVDGTGKYLIPGLFEMHAHTSKTRASALGLYIVYLSLIHISEPTRQAEISYAVFCLK